ncbi:MAG: hypothetical protein ABIH83_04545 [Candidatus Micrarchaeota archaeon]
MADIRELREDCFLMLQNKYIEMHSRKEVRDAITNWGNKVHEILKGLDYEEMLALQPEDLDGRYGDTGDIEIDSAIKNYNLLLISLGNFINMIQERYDSESASEDEKQSIEAVLSSEDMKAFSPRLLSYANKYGGEKAFDLLDAINEIKQALKKVEKIKEIQGGEKDVEYPTPRGPIKGLKPLREQIKERPEIVGKEPELVGKVEVGKPSMERFYMPVKRQIIDATKGIIPSRVELEPRMIVDTPEGLGIVAGKWKRSMMGNMTGTLRGMLYDMLAYVYGIDIDRDYNNIAEFMATNSAASRAVNVRNLIVYRNEEGKLVQKKLKSHLSLQPEDIVVFKAEYIKQFESTVRSIKGTYVGIQTKPDISKIFESKPAKRKIELRKPRKPIDLKPITPIKTKDLLEKGKEGVRERYKTGASSVGRSPFRRKKQER